MSSNGESAAHKAVDLYIEHDNHDRKKRNVGNDLIGAIHMGPLYGAMRHVSRTYREAADVRRARGSGVRASMVHEVEALVAFFVEKVGTRDLTAHTSHNPFWHTGKPRKLRGGACMQKCRPWEWVRRVAMGTSRGHMAARPEAAAEYARRMVTEHFFPY